MNYSNMIYIYIYVDTGSMGLDDELTPNICIAPLQHVNGLMVPETRGRANKTCGGKHDDQH